MNVLNYMCGIRGQDPQCIYAQSVLLKSVPVDILWKTDTEEDWGLDSLLHIFFDRGIG